MEKKLLAEALLDLAKSSTTEIINAAEDKELINAASKLGIVLPSPDLAVLKTVYAEIDKVNRNGVVLPRKAVEEGLPTLVGKQMNWEHLGSGNICGYIIDAGIKEDKIEIIAVVFKSLFPEEFEIVQDKFKKGTLAVSFEIWDKDPITRKSVVAELADGNIEINPIIFHGCGLLLTSAPACPKAKIYKLIAKEEDKSFTEDLVYAKLAIEEPKCNNCQNCTCEKEVKIVEEIKIEAEVKKVCLECQAPIPEDNEDVICSECKLKKEEKKQTAEIKVEETKVEAEVKLEEVAKTTPEETVATLEVKPEIAEEVKVEEVVVPAAVVAEEVKVEEVKIEEASTTIQTLEVVKIDEIKPDVEIVLTQEKVETSTIDDSGKELVKIVEESIRIETYTREQLDEAVAVAKEEKDKEIAKLKEELEAAKPKEIVKAKVEESTQPDLTVGKVTTTGNDEYKERRENVNLKAYGHR